MDKIQTGSRVFSSEVEAKDNDGLFTPKQLEVVDILPNGKVEVKYFSEKEIRPKIEKYIVSIESLIFISNEPLKYKGVENDVFFKRRNKDS